MSVMYFAVKSHPCYPVKFNQNTESFQLLVDKVFFFFFAFSVVMLTAAVTSAACLYMFIKKEIIRPSRANKGFVSFARFRRHSQIPESCAHHLLLLLELTTVHFFRSVSTGSETRRLEPQQERSSLWLQSCNQPVQQPCWSVLLREHQGLQLCCG